MKIRSVIELIGIIDSEKFQLKQNLKLTDLEIKYMPVKEIEKHGLKYIDEITSEIARWKKDWNAMFELLEFGKYIKEFEKDCKKGSIYLNLRIIEIPKLVKILITKATGEEFYSRIQILIHYLVISMVLLIILIM